MANIINPHTRLPVSPEVEVALSRGSFTPSKESLEAAAKAVREQQESSEAQITEAQLKEVKRRFMVMPGKIMIRKRPTAKTWDNDGLVAVTKERQRIMQLWEPWGTILMVGGADPGMNLYPHPEWKEGVRVLFNPAGGETLDLPLPGMGEEMNLVLIGFRGVLMVDRGEENAESVQQAELEAETVEVPTDSVSMENVPMESVPIGCFRGGTQEWCGRHNASMPLTHAYCCKGMEARRAAQACKNGETR